MQGQQGNRLSEMCHLNLGYAKNALLRHRPNCVT